MRRARHAVRRSLLVVCATVALAAGCSDATTKGAERGEALSGPATGGLPDGVFAVTVSLGEGYEHECFASHISPHALLLAAHCFSHIGAPHDSDPNNNETATIAVTDGITSVKLLDPRVFFYVGKSSSAGSAVPLKPQTEWTKPFEVTHVDCTHDLAMVLSDAPALAALNVVPLWTPSCRRATRARPARAGSTVPPSSSEAFPWRKAWQPGRISSSVSSRARY